MMELFFTNLQIVFSENMENFKEIEKLPISSAIVVKGTLVKTKGGAKQPFEIQANEILLEGYSDKDYPLQKKRHTFEYYGLLPILDLEAILSMQYLE